MTVGDMLRGGVRLVRTQPKALALWALLYFAAVAAMMVLVWPMMMEMAEFQRQMLATGTAAAPPPGPPSGFIGAVLLMELVLVAAMVAIFAAAVRATVRGGDDRFGFLRFGMDELRLVGLLFLLWLIATAATVVLMIAAGLLGAVLYAAGGATAAALLLPVLWLVLVLALIWAQVRLSLAGAFTVLRGRIIVGPAWRATRGRFWTLFGAYLVIGLVYTAISLLLTAILFPDLFGLYAAMFRTTDPAVMLGAQQAMFAQFTGMRMIVAMAIGTVINTALVGWLFGAVATAAVLLDAEGRGGVVEAT